MNKQIWAFITFWVLDSALLFLAAWFFPFYFRLGNKAMSAIWAAIAAGLVWTFLEWISTPLARMFFKMQEGLVMFGFYFIANFIALWITARMAPVFGFGVTSFIWLAFLAVIADVLQHLVWNVCKFKKMAK